jgi:hypothetical protein
VSTVDTFKAYFDAFEATYLDDDWNRIAPYFAPDMTYNNAEGASLQGRAAALDYLKASVDSSDRRFDVREFVGEPQISGNDNKVTMIFTVRYRIDGAPDLEISGTEIATFSGDQIVQMDDVFDDASLARFGTWMENHRALLA